MFWSPSTPTPGFLTSKHLLISAQRIVSQELHKSNMTHMTSFTLSPCVCFQKFQSSDSMSTVSAAAPRPNGLGATPQSKEIWTDDAVTLTVNTSWDPMQCLPPRSQSRRVEDHVTLVTVHIHTLSYNSRKVFPHSSKCSIHYESISRFLRHQNNQLCYKLSKVSICNRNSGTPWRDHQNLRHLRLLPTDAAACTQITQMSKNQKRQLLQWAALSNVKELQVELRNAFGLGRWPLQRKFSLTAIPHKPRQFQGICGRIHIN